MSISAIAVKTDRTNYTRYESGKGLVTAYVSAAGGAGETLTITLRRKTPYGYRVLSSQTKALASGALSATFDLTAVVDADGFPSARFSHQPDDYEVLATDGAHPGSARFTVTLASVETMRNQYMLGLPLYTIEQMAPRTQPLAITGVTVVDVSRDTKVGTATLALTVSGGPVKTLVWGSGPAVQLDLTQIAQYVLTTPKGTYIVVRVDPALLPGSSASEALVIDLARMADSTISEQLVQTSVDVERAMAVRLEPTRIVSGALAKYLVPVADPADYDEVGPAVSYYRPPSYLEWLNIKLPYRGLLKLTSLSGWFNRTHSLDVTPEWFVVNEKSGFVQLVPSNSAMIQWSFYGVGFYTIFFNMGVVPDFWNYQVVCGLIETPPDVRDFVAKRAAIPLLTMAGQARFAGVTSQSVSRDGVSESRSTVPGVYGSTIDRYERENGKTPDGRERGLSKMRDRYAGLSFVTIG